MRIVLASESPFRKRAMDLLGLPYERRPSHIDEKAIRDDDRVQLTRKLAEAKAHKIAAQCPNAIIVSGDAVVAKGSRIFEKATHPRGGRPIPARILWKHLAIRDFHRRPQPANWPHALGRRNPRYLFPSERYIQKYDVLSYAGAFENDAVLSLR